MDFSLKKYVTVSKNVDVLQKFYFGLISSEYFFKNCIKEC